MSDGGEAERARIRTEYQRRAREIPRDFYALTTPANLFLRQDQERSFVELLHQGRLVPMRGRRVLDLGCGDGGWLGFFQSLGVEASDIAGLDLDPARVAEAQARFPLAQLRSGSAEALPWPDGSFDVVSQVTMFTSILDRGMQERIAREMLRVLKPGGAVLWLDFVYDNPKNQNVKGLKAKRVQALFPGCTVTTRSCTLAPPLARRLVGFSWGLSFALQQLRFLNTHVAALIQRPVEATNGAMAAGRQGPAR